MAPIPAVIRTGAVACLLPWWVACVRTASSAEPTPDATPSSAESVAAARSTPLEPAPAEAVPAVSPESRHACDGICERSEQLHCKHAGECRPHCLAMASFTPCSREIDSFYQCLSGQPKNHWECAEDGIAAIREGFCDREQEQAVACMEAKMR